MSQSIQIQQCSNSDRVPSARKFRRWADAALSEVENQRGDVTIRIVDQEEGAALNEKFRQGRGATNVLSFPYAQNQFTAEELLGDIVICASVVQREAVAQNKTPDAHWAHMVVHGVLHLCGYDHIAEDDAREMERLEGEVLYRLGFPAPYD